VTPPAGTTERRRQTLQYLALANLTLASFMTVLNTNMIRVAVGELLATFGVSVSRLTWVFNGYTLVYAILMPISGRLGDMYGRKRFFLGGLSLFLVGSALCSIAWAFPILVIFRCVQAIGAAAVFPNALVMATDLFGAEQRGRVLGIWAAASSLGSMIGPTIGGFLAEYLAWRSIFYVNVPIGILAIAAGFIQLKETAKGKGERKPFDVGGAIALGLAMFCLLLYLTGVRDHGWGTWRAPVLLAGCAVAAWAFVRIEARAKSPMVDLAMFRNPAMLRSFGLGMVHMFCGQGSTFMLPLFLTAVKQLSPAVMGLVMFPGSLIGVVGGPISGTLSDRFGSRRPVMAGMFSRIIGNIMFALLTTASGLWSIVCLRFVTVFGGSATWSPLLSFVLAENPPERAGVVTGVFNMIRFVGGILGTTLTGMIIDMHMDATGGYVGGAGQVTRWGGAPGFYAGFMMLAAVSLAGFILSLGLRHTKEAQLRVQGEQAAGRARQAAQASQAGQAARV
jgi:EmrB/QacA subfamily drug resistance transporter